MMQISFEEAAIGHGLEAEVPPLTMTIESGVPVAIAVETDERPLLVSMMLGGRIHPDAGRILVDGREDLDELRRRTALVDTPFVSEANAGTALRVIVAEEFAFASMPTATRFVRRFLAQHQLKDYTNLPLRALPPVKRIELFSELAVLRPGVEGIVVTAPERHGGSPSDWYGSLAAIASRGLTVAIVTNVATARALLALGALPPLAADTVAAGDSAASSSPIEG